MPSSPRQIFDSLSRTISSSGYDSSRKPTALPKGDNHPRRQSVSGVSSPLKTPITVYHDPNTIIDIYAGGSTPAKRYATHGTRPRGFRATPPRPLVYPNKVIVHRRYGSHEPSELLERPVIPVIKAPRASSLNSEERRRPMSDRNTNEVLLAGIGQEASGYDVKLLPALPVAGSPRPPAIGEEEIKAYESSENLSVGSDAESASPSSNYRPNWFSRYATDHQANEPTNEQRTRENSPSDSIRTPENRYLRPYGYRRIVRGRLCPPGGDPPVYKRRVFAPRELTPTFS
ncbi:hypothetical protein M408DRAFT_27475 [Serendipita vermifera MAFF 305830]|uniref:Uncharacterized protein n=1 Tax=Serendipita vermifera MAFF 305830 TaxID=933852 RepID=A0A0C2X369_SERVB|nr:hypothetical protein M408DRAFT_27475 [Serendipita vermifera MAFF 305830]